MYSAWAAATVRGVLLTSFWRDGVYFSFLLFRSGVLSLRNKRALPSQAGIAVPMRELLYAYDTRVSVYFNIVYTCIMHSCTSSVFVSVGGEGSRCCFPYLRIGRG